LRRYQGASGLSGHDPVLLKRAEPSMTDSATGRPVVMG
jgi:hypothetical protein